MSRVYRFILIGEIVRNVCYLDGLLFRHSLHVYAYVGPMLPVYLMVLHKSHIGVVVGRYVPVDAVVSCFYAGKPVDIRTNRYTCMVFHLPTLMDSFQSEKCHQSIVGDV